ncbi:MAG: hypothetical protein HQL60_00730 [Magnetococcales bacterium]|nr:hypothetical protein [Magnetococcales bacterium]
METRSFIRAAELDESQFQRVSFTELLDGQRHSSGGDFLRYLPHGATPQPQKQQQEPEIDLEELFRRRMEQLERDTYQKVFAAAEQAGLEMGLKKREQELSILLPRVEQLIRGLEQLPPRIFAVSEQFLVEVAIVLVRELLQHELAIQPDGLVARVRKVLSQVVSQDHLTLYLAPQDVELLTGMAEFRRLRVVADETVSAGSVRVESSFGGVAYDLSQQLQTVEKGLRDYLVERLEECRSERIKQQGLASMRQLGMEAIAELEANQAVVTSPQLVPVEEEVQEIVVPEEITDELPSEQQLVEAVVEGEDDAMGDEAIGDAAIDDAAIDDAAIGDAAIGDADVVEEIEAEEEALMADDQSLSSLLVAEESLREMEEEANDHPEVLEAPDVLAVVDVAEWIEEESDAVAADDEEELTEASLAALLSNGHAPDDDDGDGDDNLVEAHP